jgi:hypothetical protein
MDDNVLWGRALKEGLRFANIPYFLLKFRKDRSFYKRRSGRKYGWYYIKSKFTICKLLNLPLYNYLLSFLIGILKMLPSGLLKFIYFPLKQNKFNCFN